jgi:protein phosphatase
MASVITIFESSALSEIGPVREDNQDTVFASDHQHPPEAGYLFAIADGMGGYAHGGLASSLALQALTSELYQTNPPNPKALRRGIETANLGIYKTAQKLEAWRMGTTLTAIFILGDLAHLAHIGDSRAYLVRNGRATCLTNDHTTVGDMVRARLISADKVRTHAQRSILTRALGLGLFVKPDLSSLKLCEGDRLILCSDGVWSVIQDDEFADIHRETSPEHAGKNLIELALERETDDNASLVVVDIRKIMPSASPASRNKKAVNILSFFGKKTPDRQS